MSTFSFSGSPTKLDNILTYTGGQDLGVHMGDWGADLQGKYDLYTDGQKLVSGVSVTEDNQVGSVGKIENKIMQIAEGRKIPERIAKWRGKKQVNAGGEMEIDRNIDNFNDALAALNITSVTFKPHDPSSPESSSTRETVENVTKPIADKFKASTFLLFGVMFVAGIYGWVTR